MREQCSERLRMGAIKSDASMFNLRKTDNIKIKKTKTCVLQYGMTTQYLPCTSLLIAPATDCAELHFYFS